MRALAILLLILPACRSQSEQSKVEAVLKQMERAEQTGDFNTILRLWTPEHAARLEKLRAYIKPRPQVRYRATTTFVQGDQAVLLVECPSNTFVTFTLRKEAGQWKMEDERFTDTAPDPKSVYALAPPAPGAFARDGSPWDRVTPALTSTEATGQGYQLKTVFDDAYLYVRLESGAELPPPGSTIDKPPGGWPVLKIAVSGAGEFVLYDAVNVGDQATFGARGKANSHRAYAAYMIRLERNRREVFSTSAGLQPSPLLTVAGRDYDIRIPLVTMGIANSRAAKITVGDAQWPKSVLFSVDAQRYPR